MKTTLTVNFNNLTGEEREQLLKLVEKSNIEKSKVWKPNEGDTYYCVNYFGQVNGNIYIPTVGSESYRLGNCFKTREEAEFAVEKQKLITEIKRYIAENDPVELDWTDSKQFKYSIYYDSITNEIYRTGYIQLCRYINGIYFSTELDYKTMISDIGEERIKRYLFNVG